MQSSHSGLKQNQWSTADKEETKNDGDNVEVPLNFRGKLWRIICKVDDLKYEVLDEYIEKRKEQCGVTSLQVSI